MTERARVLVTGANGHLGRRLVSHLAGEHHVHAVVRSEPARRQLEELPDIADIETSVLDYRDSQALTEAARESTHAVHLVGIIKESSRSRYEDAHEATTRALSAAADACGMKRIVYLSILGADVASPNPCLASKARAERTLLEARTPTLILRVPMVLGENDFASSALKRRAQASVNVLLRAQSREQPIYAGDVIQAISAGLEREALDDVILNLAGPESLSRQQLIRRAGALTGHRPRCLSIPLAIGLAAAHLLERVSPNPPITRAMLGVLDHDDDIDPAEAAKRLEIELTALDETLRRCVP